MTRYDDVAYEAGAILETHPARLRVFARLFGLDPVPLDSQRVLEIGCGQGSNLIALAAGLPTTTFVGIDLAPSAIALGNARIERLGLTNVTLRTQDLVDLDEAAPYDVILVHGVYSWVPEPVREALLAGVRRFLAPQGIAYISYNALPGWRQRGAVRDLMRMHTQDLEQPEHATAAARGVLDLVAELAGESAWGQTLKREAGLVRRVDDWYLFHDHLSPHNDPVYFREFVAHAARHGLQYVADAEREADALLSMDALRKLTAAAPDPLDFEQLVDFVVHREFRCSLVTHAERTILPIADVQAVYSTWVSSSVTPDGETGRFATRDNQQFQVGHITLQRVLGILGSLWPRALQFEDLLAQAGGTDEDRVTVATNLLDGLRGGYVRLSDAPFPGVVEPGPTPQAWRVARDEAANGSLRITSLLHLQTKVSPFDCRLLIHLDGRSLDQVIEALVEDVAAGVLSLTSQEGQPLDPSIQRQVLRSATMQQLRVLAGVGLLQA